MPDRKGPVFPDFPAQIDRTGVKGIYEVNLRTMRGTVDTTSTTAVEGEGFTITINGTGDVTLTWSPEFSAACTVTAMSIDGGFVTGVGNPTATTARLLRKNAAGADADGVMCFIATGPA